MKPLLSQIQRFFATVILGGLIIILPVVIIINVCLWLLTWIATIAEPLVSLFWQDPNPLLNQAVSVLTLIGGCFGVGIIVKTRWGQWFHSTSERWLFDRVPGYKMLKELFTQLGSDNKPSFSKPTLVKLANSEVYFTGFIMEAQANGLVTVFIPTSPSPTNGFVIQVTPEQLTPVSTSPETVMKTVLSCGVGSSALFPNKP